MLKWRRHLPAAIKQVVYRASNWKYRNKNYILQHRIDQSVQRPSSGFILILTQYKRNHLQAQLESVFSQTLLPDKVIIFQNENHVDIDDLVHNFPVDVVSNTINTKYFGRFAYALALDIEYVIIMDDDIIPGRNCFKNYMEQCKKLDGIIGGNGRFAFSNPKYQHLNTPNDTGIRNQSQQVDFVGHLWVLRKIWLYDMFSVKPHTLETGEDMHLCFSAKIKSGIASFAAAQTCHDDMSDITDNVLAVDKHSSFKHTPKQNRVDVEKYFSEQGLNFVSNNVFK